jgi:hypothetical protein
VAPSERARWLQQLGDWLMFAGVVVMLGDFVLFWILWLFEPSGAVLDWLFGYSDFLGFALVAALFISVPGCFLAMAVGSRLRRRGDQMCAMDASTILVEERTRFAIYLRSFRSDRIDIGRSRQSWAFFARSTYEETMVGYLKARGLETVAVGDPGDRLRPLGALRSYVADDWQSAINRLLPSAALVVVQIGTSTGVLWELERAIGLVPATRLFLHLPFARKDRTDVYYEWLWFQVAAKHLFPKGLPDLVNRGRFWTNHIVRFSSDWTPHVIGTFGNPERAFDEAIEAIKADEADGPPVVVRASPQGMQDERPKHVNVP